MKAIQVIAAREFTETIRTKSYAIVTILGILCFAVLSFLPTIVNWIDKRSEPTVVVVDKVGGILSEILGEVSSAQLAGNSAVHMVAPTPETPTDKADLDSQVSAGIIKAYLLVTPVPGKAEPLFELGARQPGSNLIRGVETAIRPSVMARRLADLRLAPQQAAHLQAPLITQINNVGSKQQDQGQLFASQTLTYLLLFMLYLTLLGYGSVLTSGVAAEKGSRVMEMMLVSVRPTDLLAGKILGLGAASLLQYLIWVMVGLGVSWARGALANLTIGGIPLELSAVEPSTIFYFLLYYVLGYLAYSALFASAGCLVNRPEESSQTLMPVMFLIIIAYLVAVAALANPSGTLARVASLIPVFTSMVMFTRIVMGSVPVWEVTLSVIFSIAFIWLAVQAGGRIYRYSVLRTRRAGWFEGLRGTRN